MNRPQILKLKEKKDLRKVPSKFSVIVGQQQVGQTLIIVDGDEGKVATSKEIEKILNKIRINGETQYILVITNLTIEAEKLLQEKKINLLRTSDFFWTDESYGQRHESMHKALDKRMQQLHDEKQNEN